MLISKYFHILPLFALITSAGLAQDNKRLHINNGKSEGIVRHYIPKAVEIQFTKRFRAFEGKKLLTILQNQSTPIDLSEGLFPDISWVSPEPINIEQSNINPETKKTLLEAKKFLEQAIIRPSLLAPLRPALKIGNLGYEAKFNRFALVSDGEIMEQLGRNEGVVLVLEVELRKITATANYITAWDEANTNIFDKASIQGIKIDIAGRGKTPLKMRLPFYIRTNDKSELEFEALEFDTNANEVEFKASYNEILWPKIFIRGKTFDLTDIVSPEYLDEQVKSAISDLTKQGPKMLVDFAKKELPNFLNTEFKQSVQGAFSELSTIEPIIVSEQDATLEQKKPFFWELKLEPSGINHNYQTRSFSISLISAIEDPDLHTVAQANSLLNPQSLAKVDRQGNTIRPNISLFPVEQFDVAIAINRGFINRLLQLSFGRKSFEKIPVPDGAGGQIILKALEPPTIDFYPAIHETIDPKSTYLKLHAKIKLPPGVVKGMAKAALKPEAEISADLIVNTREVTYKGNCDQNLDGQATDAEGYKKIVNENAKFVQLRLVGIDRNSIQIEKKWIANGLLGVIGRVATGGITGDAEDIRNAVRDFVEEKISLPMKQQPTHLACLQPPFDLMGIKPELTALRFDPNGYIIFFMSVPDSNAGVGL